MLTLHLGYVYKNSEQNIPKINKTSNLEEVSISSASLKYQSLCGVYYVRL